LYETLALLNKGNVLQYKKNSSLLTKQQVYSKIVNGNWTNRTTTWATQSDKYTNPNTNYLKRIGGEWISANGENADPPSCVDNRLPNNKILPSNQNMSNNNPIIPPPPPNNPNNNGNSIPMVSPDINKTPNGILDFGNLICNTTENICTGETFTRKANSNWHPTTDSDVPGPIKELYWNPRIQTWYPRQRLIMNNSTDKWPYNAKGIMPINGFIPPM
jgi:hypothetical protein